MKKKGGFLLIIIMESALIKNKKGQIPIILLVVVALVLSVIAFWAFSSFDRNLGDSAKLTSQMVSEVDFNYDYIHEIAKLISKKVIESGKSDIKLEFMSEAVKKNMKIPGTDSFFSKIRNEEFSFVKENGEYVLDVDNLFVESEKGENNMKRKFDLCMRFDLKGDYLINC